MIVNIEKMELLVSKQATHGYYKKIYSFNVNKNVLIFDIKVKKNMKSKASFLRKMKNHCQNLRSSLRFRENLKYTDNKQRL